MPYDPTETSDFAAAVVEGVLTDAMNNPLGSQFHDGEVCRRRREVEKYLKPAPATETGAIDATIEAVRAAGGFLPDDRLPTTIASLNERLRAKRDAEESARLRKMLDS